MTSVPIIKRIKLKGILGCIFIFMALNAVSQIETFDIISFSPPQSWKRDVRAGCVSFTTSRGNIFCVVGLYASRPVNTISETEFLKEWNELVNIPIGLTIEPVVKSSQFNEWTVFSASTNVTTKQSGTYVLQLISFAANGRIISASVNCNGNVFDKETVAFLSSITLLEKPGLGNSINTKPIEDETSAVALTAEEANLANRGIAGVWVGFESGNFIFGITSYDYINNRNNYGTTYSAKALAMKWRVFLRDGTYYEGMPIGGLINFNRKNKANDFAGSYVMENNVATTKLDHYSSAVRTFVFYPPGKLKYLNKYDYVKCKPVDGLTLNGTYMSADPTSRAYYISLNKPNPTISFTADGHFTDDNFLGEYSRDAQLGPGNGTYEVNNFTIVFKYADGRVIQRSFTPFLDEDPWISKVFYIGSRDMKLSL